MINNMDTSGIVYVVTNPAMTGIVKIGLTKKDEIDSRLKELFTTSVPVPFECAFACKVEDCGAVESALHTAFNPYRIHPQREFFKIEPEQAIVILRLFQKSDITKEVNKKIDSETLPEDKMAGEELKITSTGDNVKEYIRRYAPGLNDKNTLISKMLNHVKERKTVTWGQLKKVCVSEFGCKTELSGSIAASLATLEHFKKIIIAGRGDEKVISINE